MTETNRTSSIITEVGRRGSRRPADRANVQPKRQQFPHDVEEFFNQPTILFVTLTTRDRVPWLVRDSIPSLLVETWREATGWAVGRYVIMPDHVHFFCSPGTMEIELKGWITYWKSQLTKKHGMADYRWQTEPWDTRMRSASQYEEKWLYVQQNPERAGLVKSAADWPFQGEIHELRWT